jgi:hypothetical protein
VQGQAYLQSVRAQLGLPARRTEPMGARAERGGEETDALASALFTGGPRRQPTGSFGSEPSAQGSFSYLSV